MTRARTAIGQIKSEHAAHGALQSNRTYLGIFAAVRREFEAGTNTALGELKRVVIITRLDRTELRQAALQCLNDFAIEAKALINSNKLRSIDNSIIKENLRSLDEDLSFAVRQFDVRFFEPEEPEIPQVHNSISIGAMTGSTIQQGSPDAVQAVQLSLIVEPVRAALATFESAIKGVALPPATLNEITADLQTIKAQLSKPAPSVSIVQEAGRSLRAVLEGVTAGLLAPAVIAAAPALWSALGLG